MEFIELKNVFKVYKNGVTALADVSLSISAGEFVFIIGESGSGKSTLTKLLYREEKPNKGSVFVGGVNVSSLRNSNVYKLRRKIGVVFQDFKLLPKLTVYENVAYPLESYGMDKNEIKDKVLKAIERVGLKNKLRSYPNQLSGGEQQRVSIARAIVKNPKLLLCDEPTGALDSKTGKEIIKLLLSLCEEYQTTIVVVTHNSNLAELGTRLIRIGDGKIIENKKIENRKKVDDIVW